MCVELAQKGFITFSGEYRRGRIFDPNTNNTNHLTSVQQQFARYRTIQDGCGAIRTIMKKNGLPWGHADKFPFVIDTTQVFIGGQSAGGIIALGCAYYQTSADLVTDQKMIDQSFPKATTSTNEVKQVLGNMHSNRYYAEALPQYWPKIAGVVSMWGGIVIPKSYDGASNETDYALEEVKFFKQVSAAGNPPLIAFHGGNDTTVPFKDTDIQDIDLSSALGYQTESYCTLGGASYKQLNSPSIELKICSSLNMYLVMRRLNRFSEFYLDCSMGHGLDTNCIACGGSPMLNKKRLRDGTCIACEYKSTFGTAAINTQQTIKYMAERIAVFSQAIMAAYPAVLAYNAKGRSYFRDCENYRVCNGAASNACTGPDRLCNSTDVLILDNEN